MSAYTNVLEIQLGFIMKMTSFGVGIYMTEWNA